jgi:protein-L-isoaspartate(D-aspartate) O-methyltransferase
MTNDSFAEERRRMVDEQIAARGIDDARVLAAMRDVPREAFVGDDEMEAAYEDVPLPIGEGQTISQPFIVALMLAEAELRPGDRLLEVGTGSGYAAAVASRIVATVDTIERHASLAEQARRRLARLGYDNVIVHVGDGSRALPGGAMFEAILVTAGGPEIPSDLKAELAIGGRLIMPVGPLGRAQRLIKLVRRDETTYDEHDLGAVMFVPLVRSSG